ncbi:alpha/beta hydrolase [Planctomycetaceae bacterium SH139]
MQKLFSSAGLLVGTFFFACSLTPSLLPRPFEIQGLLSGLTFAVGYGIGVSVIWLWRVLHLPLLSPRSSRKVTIALALLCSVAVVASLWRAGRWQDSIRLRMGLDESTGVQPIYVGFIAIVIFLLVWGLAQLFQWVFQRLVLMLDRRVPARISRIVATLISVFLFWTVINGLLVRTVLQVADRSFQRLDAMMDDDLPRPEQRNQTGSVESLVAWEELGSQGRDFVASGPTASDLSDFLGAPTLAPIRVYVGLNSAETAAERARLALDELIRVGGFERSVLLLVTPTGTGWVDPASQDTVEYLHRGDIATVAAQYSYLNSPLSLLTEAEYGAEMARALFTEIYGHWRKLPKATRPSLYLHGLSLGSLNSDLSFDLYDIIDDPFQGALWSGPPFRHETWQRLTAERTAGSTAWLPQFRDRSVVRFMNQPDLMEPQQRLDFEREKWGDFRIAFLQHASDPIVFFSFQSAWQEPAWMQGPRGADVSPELRWFPIVTMLQVAADMIVGTAPPGYGHEYAPADYIDAWHALTEPADWSTEELQRLKDFFRTET